MPATAPTLSPVYVAKPLKPHCVNGHALTPETVLWQRLRGPFHKRGLYPVCLICRRASQRGYAERRKSGGGA